ncbi:hypothetical protein QJQ45_003616 [Haematococcus lacustris]|nr:hypothetical protein QJQ45_003616 [Haematococcus lacustris]
MIPNVSTTLSPSPSQAPSNAPTLARNDEAVAEINPGKAGEYLVQWEGYDASFNTWEPRANLTGCDKLLAEYNAIHCLE